MEANSTKRFQMPIILDGNGDQTWHICNIDMLKRFAVYSNKTRILEVFPDFRTFGDF